MIWILSCPLAEANVVVSSDKERIQMLESIIKEKDETIKRFQQELAMERLRVERFDFQKIIRWLCFTLLQQLPPWQVIILKCQLSLSKSDW